MLVKHSRYVDEFSGKVPLGLSNPGEHRSAQPVGKEQPPKIKAKTFVLRRVGNVVQQILQSNAPPHSTMHAPFAICDQSKPYLFCLFRWITQEMPEMQRDFDTSNTYIKPNAWSWNFSGCRQESIFKYLEVLLKYLVGLPKYLNDWLHF